MNAKLTGICAGAMVVMAGLISCVNDDGPGTGVLFTSGNNDNVMSISYRVSGNTLIVTMPDTITMNVWCNDSMMDTTYDTTEASTDTSEFALSGNTLRIKGEVDSADTAYDDPSVVIYYWTEMTRVGSGAGLVGTWTWTGRTYELAQGSLTTAERERLDSTVTPQEGYLSWFIESVEYVITNDRITMSFSMCMGEFFVDNWNGVFYPEYAESTYYNIGVVNTGCDQVRMTGNASGEVVTITWNSAGDQTYRSSNPEHEAFTYYSEPRTCPNPYRPEWYSTFLMENMKVAPLQKKAVGSADAASVGVAGVRLLKQARQVFSR